MRAIAEAAGLTVHAFTKPHLFSLNERFLVAGAPAKDDALIAAAERVSAAAPDLTQFDAQVAAAFVLFSAAPADLVLVETGMGGREDSTNVLERPALCVVTPVDLDHQDALGPTLADIAAHKAGILKSGVTAIVARQHEAVRGEIEARAGEIGASLLLQRVEWDAFESSGRLVVQTEARALDLPLPALHGAHQIDNAGLACAALMRWREFPDAAFAAGVANARWPGRLAPLTRGALSAPVRAAGGEVWIDGGHNAHAARALARALRDMQRRRPAPTIAIVGMRARKQSDAFLGALAGSVDLIVAAPLTEPHVAPTLIAAQARLLDVEADTAPTLEAAMRRAAQFPAPRVLVCGSLLLAAAALAAEAA
jgi:dihydrofolate synthase/folylpolyglutamate synthase